jgi:hypothetical protein
MREIRNYGCSVFIVAILTLNVCIVFADNTNPFWGSLYKAIPLRPQSNFSAQEDALHRWNRIAVDASGLDHTPARPGENRLFGEQIGPGRASRAMAIVHVAIFDAINSIAGGYNSYTNLPRTSGSIPAAIITAAHDTLVVLYPSQANRITKLQNHDLAEIPDSTDKVQGIDAGRHAAAAILELRSNDGSQHDEPRMGIDFTPSNKPGKWREDPVSHLQVALGAHWSDVKPFVLKSSQQFRVVPPPQMISQKYVDAYYEVFSLGGDGITTRTSRTDDQTLAAVYWAYDGTPSLCAPPRLYNQITLRIASQMGSNMIETARLLVLVNVAMADAGIAIWESKFYYQFWRPVCGIREANVGAGPSGLGDGNSSTHGDQNFMPLGAPASNLNGPNFTPPFPSYPSGHAGFGGALFQILRRFYKTDRIAFTFVSDEFNGVTKDNNGNVRPLIPRSFDSLSQAEEENGQSRIYLGIHWSFDKTEGIKQGRQIADYVFNKIFRPDTN